MLCYILQASPILQTSTSLQAVQANLVAVRALTIRVACITETEKLIASLQHDLHQHLVRSECAQSEVPSIECTT